MHNRSFFCYITVLLIASCNYAQPALKNTHSKSNLTKYLNEKKWNELFPHRYNISTYEDNGNKQKAQTEFYSFKAFLHAAEMFPLFLNEGDSADRKRELCAFLANVSQETGGGWDEAPGGYYKWGLHYVEEKGCANGCVVYSDTLNKVYPSVKGRSYHGRGPLQLSWNYNYGQFSEAYFGKKDSLLLTPERVSNDPILCFASAIWFWMATQYPKPSCHDVICGKWIPNAKDSANGRLPGFGAVVNVINGGLECGVNHSDNTKYRYGFYSYYCKYFQVSPGANAECSTQQRFGLK